MKRLLIGIMIVLAIGAMGTFAEMRTWTDKKGNSIEAEFVSIFSGKVVLKTASGKQVKVPQSGLSAKDQKYLENAIPPTIEIDVFIDKESKQISSDGYGYSRRREKIKGRVTLTKKNRESSCRKFTAHLYVFGKDLYDDEIWILDKTQYEFSFEHQKKIEFSGNQSTVTYTDTSYSNDHGDKYDGYLVFIKDSGGNVVCIKGSRSKYEKKVTQIEQAKKKTRFDSDLNPVNR